MAAPLHLSNYGSSNQQSRCRSSILAGDKARQGAIESAQQTRISQALQSGQGIGHGECGFGKQIQGLHIHAAAANHACTSAL